MTNVYFVLGRGASKTSKPKQQQRRREGEERAGTTRLIPLWLPQGVLTSKGTCVCVCVSVGVWVSVSVGLWKLKDEIVVSLPVANIDVSIQRRVWRVEKGKPGPDQRPQDNCT